MNKTKLKTIFADGLILALPLAIAVYFFTKVLIGFRAMVKPFALKLGIERIFGGLTLSILATLLIVVCIMLLGLAMRLSVVEKIRTELERILLKFFPPLNQLKGMLADRLDREEATNAWKAVILCQGNKFEPAFLVEETEEAANFFVVKGPSVQDGSTLILSKQNLNYFPITSSDLRKWVKHNGKGALQLIKQ